jgi:hypothetical protein
MPSNEKSLLGCFTELLPQCKSSKTSHKEGKGEIRVTPIKGKEIVCFFIIDNDSARHALRMVQGNTPTERKRYICDCLIFFGRTNQADKISEETFCLVELKGSDLKHAMKQISNTYDHLWKSLEDSPCKNNLGGIRKKAYIYKHGNTPKESKDKDFVVLRKELESKFDVFAHRRDSDIGPFLRK